MINLPATLQFLRPGASWHLLGDTYEGLTWADTTQVKPTWQEIVDAQILVENARIDELRMEAYRRESDPVFFQWQRGEKTQADWQNSISAVKARHPKPTAPPPSGGTTITTSSSK